MPHSSSMLALGVKHSACPAAGLGQTCCGSCTSASWIWCCTRATARSRAHTVFDSEEIKRVAERTTILKPLPEDR